MRYELTDLKLFLAIAQAGNLSAGANAVHLTASAASYRLKNLEFALGTPLFSRMARGMELTPAGLVMLRHVRELLAGIERMHGEVSRFSTGLKGSVKLLANSSSLNGFVVPSLSRLLSSHPNINVSLKERPSNTIVAAIVAQEADIGILAGEVDSDQVNAFQYAVDELILAAPVNHPISGNTSIRFDAALDLDFVCTSKSSSNYLFLREIAQRAGKSPNVRLHVHNFNSVLTLVEEGVGVALVPRSVAVDALNEKRVAGIILREPWALRHLTLVTKAGSAPSAFAATVAEYLLNDPAVAVTRALPSANGIADADGSV